MEQKFAQIWNVIKSKKVTTMKQNDKQQTPNQNKNKVYISDQIYLQWIGKI